MSAPQWSDSDQGDLLELVAQGVMATTTADEEWRAFRLALRVAADETGDRTINPNTLRPLVRDVVAPKRIAAFTSRAIARKLIEPTGGWEISDDHQGRNAGRPCREYRWIGGAA